MTKRCTVCGRGRDVSQFYTYVSHGRKARRSECKLCTLEKQRARRARDADLRRARTAARREYAPDYELVDAAPFVEWLKEWRAVRGHGSTEHVYRIAAESLSVADGSLRRAVNRALSGAHKRIAFRTADAVMTAADLPDLAAVLYPLNELA